MVLGNYSNEGTYSSLLTLLRHYKLKHSRQFILDQIERNPHFPSIRTLSDILEEMNIENRVYNIDSSQLENIETPFIAYVKVNNGEFVWVKELNAHEVILTIPNLKDKKISINQFQSIWTGIALFVDEEKLIYSKEKGYLFKEFLYTIQSKKYLFFIISAIALLCLSINAWKEIFVDKGLFVITNLFGILVSTTIIIKTYFDSNLLKRLCNVGKLIECNSILQSQFAKPFGWLSLGEWGLIFFLINFALSISHYTDCKFLLLVLFSVGIAITFVSLGIQIWVRRICMLCLMLILEIWAGFAFLLSDFIPVERVVTTKGLLFFLSWSASIFFGWIIIRKYLLDSLKYNRLKIKSNPFYAKPSILHLMLEQKPLFSIPVELKPIANIVDQPKHRIDLVLSPSCPHCADTLIAIKGLIGRRNDIAVQIIIYPNPLKKDEIELANQLMSIYIQQNFGVFMNAAQEWYSGYYPSVKRLVNKYRIQPVTIAEIRVKDHIKWCDSYRFSHLPIVAIDGYLLPECYDANDLKYLL
jgi:predicted double-glycine peptidase/uncharacterized membrane protein